MFTKLLPALALLTLALASPPTSNDGTFKTPSASTRVRFRYWLPDASVDPQVVASDIQAAGSLGAGGVEFLPFYNYGGEQGPMPEGADWARYGFGTPAYKEIFKRALRAHAESGLVMDFTLGPNQGQGVPAEWDDQGLQWDLVPFTSAVGANGLFDGVIPRWGTGELVSLTSALVLSEEKRQKTIRRNLLPVNVTWTEYVLSHDSLTDQTSKVSRSGRVRLVLSTKEAPAGAVGYRLFAFYQKLSGNKSLHFHTDQSETIFDNGSYVVDHHSARGAETVIKFWEEYMLDDEEIAALLRQVGDSAWEDSVELISNITWTPSLPKRFAQKHGYSMKPLLPLLAFGQTTFFTQSSTVGPFHCLLDSPARGTAYLNDYHSVLEDGYNDFIITVRNWLHKRLGVTYSNQPAYGFPQDMTAAITHVDVPEYESWAYGDAIDAYRQFIGMAHLAGKKIISNELGAQIFKAYSMPIRQLLGIVHRAIIGGTNQVILHGQPYSGDWYGTTWPGYTPFMYMYSDMYSPKQPAWENGYEEVMHYISRLQFVQRQGVPRTDVALYNSVSVTNMSFPRIYQGTDLEEDGWSYLYVSSHSLDLPQAKVRNGVLAAEGPAFKALIIENTQNLTCEVIAKVHRYAKQGLPIILVGGAPRQWQSHNSCSDREYQRSLSQLTRHKNVHTVSSGQAAAKLARLGLRPRVKVEAPGIVHSTWREDRKSNAAYSFLLNSYNESVTGSAAFQHVGVPYILDPWTGEKSLILYYTSDARTTCIPINLQPGQTILVAFERKPDRNSDLSSCHVTSLSSEVFDVTRAGRSSLLLSVPGTTSSQITGTLSNGKRFKLHKGCPMSNPMPPIKLSNWTLTAEHWERPSNMYNASTIAQKRNTTHTLPTPTSWLNISGLENASGVGYHSTTFSWTPSPKTGLYIHLSQIIHTLRFYINGQQLEPLDHQNPVRDISPYLREGDNEVRAVVPTMMWNYLLSIKDEIRASGVVPEGIEFLQVAPQIFPPLDEGLVGDVMLVPFERVVVRC